MVDGSLPVQVWDWPALVLRDRDKRALGKSSRSSGRGAVAGVVGIESGVVSGVFNLELSGLRASDWRPRHDKRYHEA